MFCLPCVGVKDDTLGPQCIAARYSHRQTKSRTWEERFCFVVPLKSERLRTLGTYELQRRRLTALRAEKNILALQSDNQEKILKAISDRRETIILYSSWVAMYEESLINVQAEIDALEMEKLACESELASAQTIVAEATMKITEIIRILSAMKLEAESLTAAHINELLIWLPPKNSENNEFSRRNKTFNKLQQEISVKFSHLFNVMSFVKDAL